MRSDYTFITFATETPTKYMEHLERLRENCQKFDIPLVTEIMPHPFEEKNYQKLRPSEVALRPKADVCLQKPIFIKRQMQRLQKPVIYLDCDSLFFGRPDIPRFNFDIGIIKRTSGSKGVDPIVAGCIAFNTTQKAASFLECWHQLCEMRNICPTGDHRRFLATRVLMSKRRALYNEQDLTPAFSGKLVFNPDAKRESRC